MVILNSEFSATAATCGAIVGKVLARTACSCLTSSRWILSVPYNLIIVGGLRICLVLYNIYITNYFTCFMASFEFVRSRRVAALQPSPLAEN